eukprot:4974178-Amphidinium_carterae.3
MEAHAVVSTPAGNSNAGAEDLEPLGSSQHGIDRKAIGMIQWIALRRPDILYALKELGRQLASPRQTDWQSLRRLSKYLETAERYRLKLSVGEDDHMLRCYSDSIWRGCQETSTVLKVAGTSCNQQSGRLGYTTRSHFSTQETLRTGGFRRRLGIVSEMPSYPECKLCIDDDNKHSIVYNSCIATTCEVPGTVNFNRRSRAPGLKLIGLYGG